MSQRVLTKFSHYEQCPKCAARGRDTRADNLGVYADGSKHCFSCGYHEYAGVRALLESKLDQTKEVNVKATIPSDFTREIPAEAWKWVLKYGLPYSYWEKYCGYSTEKGPRLVFKVGNPVQFSIGRFIGDTSQAAKWYVWGDSHKHCEVLDAYPNHRETPINLVEDIVSAHKVAQIGTTIPLFGTEVHKPHLYYLQQVQRPINLWLDPDQLGNISKKAMRLQILVDVPITIISTTKDPKDYSFKEIKEILQ